MTRRFLIPEVIQTSAMDCGPAALKALFGGFGVYLSYGRLREICHTDVDGTSIDTLEEVAHALGLEAEQRMLPVDFLLAERSSNLPAIVVVRLPDGAAHFVVVWRCHGRWLQIMDPSVGRLWVRRERFLQSLYVHEQLVAAAAWEEWSRSAVFENALDRRLAALGGVSERWPDRAHQDAALRLAGELRAAGQLDSGAEARDLLSLCRHNPAQIPARFWAARTDPDLARDPTKPPELVVRGAVLVSASRPLRDFSGAGLSPGLSAVLNEPPPQIWRLLWSHATQGAWALWLSVAVALIASALGIVGEALLLEALLDPRRHLPLGGQRLAALAALLAFFACMLGLRWPATLGLLQLGRHLELRLRARFLHKIPRLEHRYFQTRSIADLAGRLHSVRLLRTLPELAGEILRLGSCLVFTVAAIAYLYPHCLAPTLVAVLIALGLPFLFQPALTERDLRFREFDAIASRFQLDALLGGRAIRAHSGALNLQASQGELLGRWARAGLSFQGLVARAEALQLALTLAPMLFVVQREVQRTQDPAGLLLLVYWACAVPPLASQLATLVSGLPSLKNTLLRLLEPLGSPSQEPAEVADPSGGNGVAVEIDRVSLFVGGQPLLEDVSLGLAPNEHIAIVGASGSGKSSLVGLLLGWNPPASGAIRIDGGALDAARLAQLRRETAWVDPEVQLFKSTLFDNLRYGNPEQLDDLSGVLVKSQLETALHHMPRGLQTPLGEGGALVSGGEGQRARAARAFLRSGVRLVILDEASRGLDASHRRQLLGALRQHFAQATLISITHHITDTLDFDRVVVVDGGRIIEAGPPGALRQDASSRYSELLERELRVQRALCSRPGWQRLYLADGQLGAEP